MNRSVVEHIVGIERDSYAWRIDTWPDVEDMGPLGEGIIEGPSNAPDALLEQVRQGKGTRFRMLDDDGLIYCKGRLLYAEGDEDRGYMPERGPLDDYGSTGLGCVDIDLWLKGDTGTYSWVRV